MFVLIILINIGIIDIIIKKLDPKLKTVLETDPHLYKKNKDAGGMLFEEGASGYKLIEQIVSDL